MSTLGRTEILRYLEKSELSERLVVTPLLEAGQVGPASVDIRLGNAFVVTRRGHLQSIDPARAKSGLKRYQYHHYVNFGESFTLHPNQLVLASSLEYVRLPTELAASVTSRSKWGRAGLVIATATAVHPGFNGTITLELVNLGEVPLILYPGLRIAQLVFAKCEGGTEYEGQYSGQTDPNFLTIAGTDQEEVDFWVSDDAPV